LFFVNRLGLPTFVPINHFVIFVQIIGQKFEIKSGVFAMRGNSARSGFRVEVFNRLKKSRAFVQIHRPESRACAFKSFLEQRAKRFRKIFLIDCFHLFYFNAKTQRREGAKIFIAFLLRLCATGVKIFVMQTENIEKFINEFAKSLAEETFVKMTLGNYKGADKHLQKLLIRVIETRRGQRLFFLYRQDTRDTAKNYDFAEGAKILRRILGYEFFSGHLFTTANDFQLDIGKKGKSRLNVAKATFKTKPKLDHDREKRVQVNQNAFYLKALGITTDAGEIRDKQHDKWRQINKFVETLSNLFDKSNLKDQKELKIVDMGSGKGYLTFAAYDFFVNIRGIDAQITGVDGKSDLVGLCNDIAESSEFENLKFVHGWINDFEIETADILIALHACNTATDDAIFKGIRANADLIVVAPCCHQEIRPQMKSPEMLQNVLKHGIMLEREAEIITDGLRSLLLEKSGYATRIFEFIATEHTPKNNMIVGTKQNKTVDSEKFDEQINSIKEFYGIEDQRLERLLK
jgi:SAM-dependent methyltransferase